MIHTTVARVLSPTQIILAAGSHRDVREGMVFVIYELGEELFDPETSESLGRVEIIKGRVKVTHVQEKISHASTLSHVENRTIDPFAAIAPLIRREVKETVYEQLKVEGAVGLQADLTVRQGDKARSIE